MSLLTREDLKNQSVRDRWDPWDPLERFDKDGENIRRKGGGLGRKQATKTLEALISSGELDSLSRATSASTDVVYFVQREDGGPVKVGHTTMRGLASRVKALQTAHSDPLEVRGLFDGGAWLEAALHQLFDSSHIRGEWFGVTETMQRICPEVVGGT